MLPSRGSPPSGGAVRTFATLWLVCLEAVSDFRHPCGVLHDARAHWPCRRFFRHSLERLGHVPVQARKTGSACSGCVLVSHCPIFFWVGTTTQQHNNTTTFPSQFTLAFEPHHTISVPVASSVFSALLAMIQSVALFVINFLILVGCLVGGTLEALGLLARFPFITCVCLGTLVVMH